METLYNAHWVTRYVRRLEPVVARAAADLQAVPTEDPVLRSGRTGWRRLARALHRLGALEPVRFCSEVRDFVRSDFHRTPAMREAERIYLRALRWDTSDIDERLLRAVKRLEELGVPTADAKTFSGLSDY